MVEELHRKVARITEHLSEKVSGANVECERKAGVVYFTIDDAGTRFSIRFTEQFLLRKSDDDLAEEVRKHVERMLCETSQRPIRRAN